MIEENIINLIAEYLGVGNYEIDSSTHLSLEYSLSDSDIEEIISILEGEYDINIPLEDFNELDSIREIAEYIEELYW